MPTPSSRWTEMDRLLAEALERPEEERAAFLDSACGEDTELRESVERLLLEADTTDPALEPGAALQGPLWDELVAGSEGKEESLGESSARLEPGACLGSYEILSLEGAGGMGEVYRAKDTELGREVAIKVLPESFADDTEHAARFEREARSLASLNHPNVATLYSIETAGELRFLVMELVDGETFAERLTKGAMAVDDALPIFQQIAEGLEAAHARGIIHRDLKPANIKITPEGRVKILDFGLAKAIGQPKPEGELTRSPTLTTPGTRASALMGTAAYMSPEQWRGKAVDKRSDIWAFGCVLYEALTGTRAFEGESSSDLAASVLTSEPDWSLVPSLPRTIERLMRRCLQKDAQRRLHAIADARIEIEEALGDSAQAGARIPGGDEGILARNKRRLWGAAAIAAVLLAVVAGTVWLTNREPAAGVEMASPAAFEPKMIVVLPFENLGSSDKTYFAAGMTSEITTRLGKLDSLGVMSSSSATRYASSDRTIQEMGEDGVEYFLEGTVLWSGDRVRINPQLISVADETRLWGTSYDRLISVENLIDIQTEIAENVSEQLGLSLLPTVDATATSIPTTSIEAYQAYFRGHDAAQRANWVVMEESMATAVGIDPEFALAWAWLSNVRTTLYGEGRNPEQRDGALFAAQRARELAPRLSETHAAFAYYYLNVAQDSERAYRELELAAASLNSHDLHMNLGLVLASQGDCLGASKHFEKAYRFNPRNFWPSFHLARCATNLRQYQRADDLWDQAISLAPGIALPYVGRAWNMALWKGWEAADQVALPDTGDAFEIYWRWAVAGNLGRYEEAHRWADRLPPEGFVSDLSSEPRDLLRARILEGKGEAELARESYESARVLLEGLLDERPEDDRLWSALGLTYAGLGRKQDAIRCGEKGRALKPLSSDAMAGAARLTDLARIYGLVGEAEKALEVMEELLSNPVPFSVSVMEDWAAFDSLRDDPGYRRLVEKYQ